jgi:chorismate mutase
MINLDIESLESWSGVKNRPMIIAGPCSAETRDQIMDVAGQLKGKQVDVMRAGIWKPRTRPNAFEGVGEDGLKWLKEAKETYGHKMGTEVANPQHVELALKYGMDVLWIGARTSVNPFSMQEIADSLKGVDIPVLVKNPINPDTQLWIGALERIRGAGITKLAAIHRGCSTYQKIRYRNLPMWNMAIELKRLIPEMPIINDPSHIAGKRDLILEVSQRAMDLGLDGLMIESHPDPEKAWSDAAQQVTPARLVEILGQLKIRSTSSDSVSFNETLEELRDQIDLIDKDIIEVLASRMKIVEKIAEYKRDNNVTTLQASRWDALLKDRVALGKAQDLSEGFISAIYEEIHRASIKRQSEIMNNQNINA